jgi:hypothetical protein
MVPSLPMVTVVAGGMFKGPDSDKTGKPLAVVTRRSALTPQIAGPRVGLLAVGAAHRDVALAVDRDIEVAARALHDAAGEIRAGVARHRIDAGRVARAVDRLADEGHRVGAKADGADVRDVVVVDGLRLHDLLRARHRHIEPSIHWSRCR